MFSGWVEPVVAVVAVLSIGLGLLVGAFFRGEFVGSVVALALSVGGWFVFIVTVTGGLRSVF